MNQLCTADMTNYCSLRLSAGSDDSLMGEIMEVNIGSINWLFTTVAIVKDVILSPLNDYFLLCFAFWILIA